MSNADFLHVFLNHNTNAAFDQFFGKLMEIYNSSFPIKRKKIKSNLINAPWVTPELKKCIKKKYRLFNLLKRGLIQKRQFNVYKNALIWMTNKIRRKYLYDKFEACKGDSKKTWSGINQLLGRGKQTTIDRIITDDGCIVEGPSIATHFNNFCTRVVLLITQDLPLEINFDYFRNIQHVAQSCFFYPADVNEVMVVIKSMPNKGISLVDIKPNILLMIPDIVGPLIAHVYNLGICDGIYPDALKIGRVTPAFKSGEVTKMNNYRPISNLLTINKIFELLTYKRMNEFIDRFHILSNLQYGFRKAKNTTQAIFRVVGDILRTFNEKSYTIALFVDLRKAFDAVNRAILMPKLSLYGFRGVAIEFLSSYLTNRRQYVNINNHNSEIEPINVGVPQGSVLGPLLFNIFINDIVGIGTANKVLFADDAIFYVTEKALDLCVEKMKLVIAELSEWLDNNKLVPNVSKTKVMMFTPRTVGDLPDMYFNGTKLEWASSMRYLGIIIDNKLNFALQSNEVYRRLSKMHGVFHSLSALVPRTTLVTLYHSLVYPIIIHNIIIWGGIPAAGLKNIKTMINNILRCILRVRYDQNNVPLMSVSDMYKCLSLLKFDDVYKYFLLRFLHFSFYKDTETFNKYYLPLLPTHSYGARGTRINLPSVRVEVERQFALFQSCKLLNEIPSDLIQPQSNYSLKIKYKRRMLSQY